MEAAGDMRREDRWQSKDVLSTAHQLAAKVPLLSVGDVGWGGPALIVLLGSSRDSELHLRLLPWAFTFGLGNFVLSICFAGPPELPLKVFFFPS